MKRIATMPLYEYICQECGSNFEKLCQFSEQVGNPECPNCRSTDTYKKLSRVAVSTYQGQSSYSSASTCSSTGRFTWA